MHRWLLLLLLVLPGLALAQVEVVESEPDATSEDLYPRPTRPAEDRSSLYPQPARAAAQAARPAGSGAAAPTVELFNQLQILQQEVMELRGMVEEHEQTIRQLKQQRLDDYMSLDRRIAELSADGGAAGQTSATTPTDSAPAASAEPATQDEEEAYRAAYGLVKARRFDEATLAFERFVGRYPRGELAPNAQYWLGELYLLEGRNDAARTQFETLLARHEGHRKAPDAMFKLAKVYHLEGRGDDAERLLNRVVAEHGGSSAARLAGEYLEQNF